MPFSYHLDPSAIGSLPETLAVPSGFTWAPTFGVFKRYGSCYTDYNFAGDADDSGKEYFVNRSTGSDADTGLSAGHAFASLAAALATPDFDIIHGEAGIYGAGFTWGASSRPTRRGTLLASSGKVIVRNEYTTPVWSRNATYSDVWEVTKASGTALGAPIDESKRDSNGDAQLLTLVASIAAVHASSAAYFISGTTLYLKTFDDRTPDSSIVLLLAGTNAGWNPDYQLYVKDFEFQGSAQTFASQGAATGGVPITFDDCAFKYATSTNGLVHTGPGLLNLNGCIARFNMQDGFNYTSNVSGAPDILEFACRGEHNGYVISGLTNNGSTTHLLTRIARVNGIYTDNQNRDIHDINDALSWNAGCMAGGGAQAAWACGITGQTHGAKMWLDGCYRRGAGTDLETNLGTEVKTRAIADIASWSKITTGTLSTY